MSESAADQAPEVSVLIPAYNVEAVLERAVNSALAQTLHEIEVLIIDDASSDRTVEVAGQLCELDERVRLIRAASNGGPGVARTLGLREAKGEWVAVLDADDQYEPQRLERLVQDAAESNLDMIADNLSLVDPGIGQIVGSAYPLLAGEIYQITPERMLRYTVPAGRINLGWCKPMIRTSFLRGNEIEWRAFRHAEDFLIDMEVLLAGGKFALVGEAMYHYTQRRGSSSKATSVHSRTNRSVKEQQQVIEDLLLRRGAQIAEPIHVALLRMSRQIEVAGYLQDARDAYDRGAMREVLLCSLRSLRNLGAFFYCALARYGFGAGKLK